MRTVMVAGTFDLLHPSHVSLLEHAKIGNDRLIVMLSTEEFNTIKGKKCVMSYEERYYMLMSLSCVDLVIPEKSWDDKEVYIEQYAVTEFVMGSDWEGKFDDLPIPVRYLPRGDISTTDIKQRVISMHEQNLL